MNKKVFEKYRKKDVLKIVGIDAFVYEKNERGELAEPSFIKSADWLTSKEICVNAETVDFESWILNHLNAQFENDVDKKDICILDGTLSFWRQEDECGYCDEEGECFVNYCIVIAINGRYVTTEDLSILCPSFHDY